MLDLTSTVHDVMLLPEVNDMFVVHPPIGLCRIQPEFMMQAEVEGVYGLSIIYTSLQSLQSLQSDKVDFECQTGDNSLIRRKLRSMINLHCNYGRGMNAHHDASRSKHISVNDACNTSIMGYGSYDECCSGTSGDTPNDLSRLNCHDAGCAKDHLAADAQGATLIQPYITGARVLQMMHRVLHSASPAS